MTVYLVISLSKIPYIHCIYVWFWPTLCKRIALLELPEKVGEGVGVCCYIPLLLQCVCEWATHGRVLT